MGRRQPEGPPPPPVVQRVRVHYAKRGRLRFTSHRDFARSLERALRRADVPIAYSAGFSPHPRISYVGAAPTGVSSEAEYLELALSAEVVPAELARALDAALPDGLDVVEVVTAGPGSLAERMQASVWRIEIDGTAAPGTGSSGIPDAVAAFLSMDSVPVERLTKDGRRAIDARAPVESLQVSSDPQNTDRAILVVVVRQVTPTVRPDDVLAGLRSVSAMSPSAPTRATRLAQGPLEADGTVGDPLAADRCSLPATTSPALADRVSSSPMHSH
ncbi:MAG: TIGR03936 family radical SAM-associated protein [Actinomycetota bacterium]|nr:TIGR03936 family radical SAM-associated protein [Actinomycetota bacterium]